MAFVIPKSEKQSIFADHTHNPGPGCYHRNHEKFDSDLEFCAPFNASSLKQSYFDVEATNYGPGSYETKYYKDLNKPVSLCPSTHIFASKVERFKSENIPCEVPTENRFEKLFHGIINEEYLRKVRRSQSASQNHTDIQRNQAYKREIRKNQEVIREIRETNAKRRVESIRSKRDYVRVLLSTNQNTENLETKYFHKSIMGKSLGPGGYQNIHQGPKPRHVTSWSKDKTDRFKTLQDEGSRGPGPGSYDASTSLVASKNRHKLSASFSSSEMRTHLDSVICQTNIPMKAIILKNGNFKDKGPGPGTYEPRSANKDKKSFNKGTQNNFGASNRNFLDNTILSEIKKPGPGSYEAVVPSRNKRCNDIIRSMRKQIFSKKNQVKKGPSHVLEPDPNLVHDQFARKNRLKKQLTTLKERCYSKLGNMSQEERFKKQKQLQDKPGPFDYADQESGRVEKCQSAIFKSVTKREALDATNMLDLPFYNMIRNDIGPKVERTKKYIENLKKINIERIPFGSSSKSPVPKESIASQVRAELPIKEVEVIRPKIPSSTFKSNTNRNIFPPHDSPAPGQYDSKATYVGRTRQLQKKSFNKEYNHEQVERKKKVRIWDSHSKLVNA